MNVTSYWTRIQHLVREEASADISSNIDAVRVMKEDDVNATLRHTREMRQEDSRTIHILESRLHNANELNDKQQAQLDQTTLRCNSYVRENMKLRLEIKEANAKVEELTKGIVKLALALVE